MAHAKQSPYPLGMDLLAPAVRIDSKAFGAELRSWRAMRGQSQLALALGAGVSTRHISYLETGRATPSREMVGLLGQALDVPLRERNQLLVAAGYAPIYREMPLNSAPLAPIREALQFIMAATEPNPTFIVNRRYDVVEANATARWLLSAFCVDLASFEEPWNLARLIIRSQGMRPFLVNGNDVARKVLGRVRRDLGGAHQRDVADQLLLDEVDLAWKALGEPDRTQLTPAPLLVGVHLRRDGLELNVFTTIATLGTPQDVTLQELRIESLFPADLATKEALANRERASAE